MKFQTMYSSKDEVKVCVNTPKNCLQIQNVAFVKHSNIKVIFFGKIVLDVLFLDLYVTKNYIQLNIQSLNVGSQETFMKQFIDLLSPEI